VSLFEPPGKFLMEVLPRDDGDAAEICIYEHLS